MERKIAIVAAGLTAVGGAADVLGAKPELDVKYDIKHERNVLDFWPAKDAGKPAPVFVWFHGGGFRNGDKGSLAKRGGKMIEAYREAGYAVVSCNHPREALLIRDKAKEFGIPCVAISQGRNGLPAVKDGETWLGLQLKFCEEHLLKKEN